MKVAYLGWAREFFGRARYNLASSGIGTPPFADAFGSLNLEDPSALAELPRTIARFHDVPESHVVPALGASHALWLAFASLVTPGCHVLVEHPVYEPLIRIPESLGARVSFFQRRAPSWAVDANEVLRLVTPETRVVALSNLHNPTGTRTPNPVLRELAAALASRNVSLLVDEVYAPFDDFSDQGRWLHSAHREHTNIVAVSSLTKGFGLGVHRLGWLLADPRIAETAHDLVTLNVGLLPTSLAALGMAAFAHIDRLSRLAQIDLRTKRETVNAWMAARGDVVWSAPSEGLFGLCVVPGSNNLRETIEKGTSTDSVVVVPGVFFGSADAMRIAWSLPTSDLPEALHRLGIVLDRALEGAATVRL